MRNGIIIIYKLVKVKKEVIIMAMIESVDYKRMPLQANEMRGEARLLNREINEAYESIKNMHQVWYGIRYNELTESFNDMIPAINELLTLVVTQIPYTLETIANNYSQADSGQKVVSPIEESPSRIEMLLKTNDVGMKFLTAEVNEVKQNVAIKFENAKESMSKIESIYAKIVWESEAAEAFRAKFTTLKNEIIASFENINTQFKKLMEQAEQDIENAEKANTVN